MILRVRDNDLEILMRFMLQATCVLMFLFCFGFGSCPVIKPQPRTQEEAAILQPSGYQLE